MKAWLPAIMLLLAGCSSVETPALEPATNIVTDPDDFSYLANRTDGGGWHIHDYWGGEDRLQLLDESDPVCTCTTQYSGSEYAPMRTYVPGPDHVVPQGTAWVHVTADWTIESGEYDGVALFVRTASGTAFQFITELRPGETITFNSTHDDNDPPHQSLSLWAFRLAAIAPADQETVLNNYGSSMQVEVERGLEIPEWPPHPDFWNGTDELTFVDVVHEVQLDAQAGVQFCSGCIGGPWLPDGAVVPFDADHVQIDITSDTPMFIGLRAHGANSREFQDIEPEIDEPLHKSWRMEVLEHRGDSPYAKHSLWEFWLHHAQDAGIWSGSYHVTVTAHR